MQTFFDKHASASDFVIAVHYRGTDKKIVWPYVRPSYDTFGFYVNTVMEVCTLLRVRAFHNAFECR